ncbi:hypothetical protein F2P56_013655 [Juglans regia]|uniref:Uncharacterized protein n=1 Tax=Juglans regia TaxID=51240 RepID=A0A834CZA9_JUGRE|nr:hypothetical protein F2P56_013655 [Juglans regia]
MSSKHFIILFYIFPSLILFHPAEAQSWVKAGYWLSGQEISGINSTLFTHIICGYADINTSTYELHISPNHERDFSAFMNTVKQENPSITTLLSIGGENLSFSLMANSSVRRKSLIDSSLKIARRYSFQGVDLTWIFPDTSSDMNNFAILLEEGRLAVESEAKNNSQPQLILTAVAGHSPVNSQNVSYPVDSMQKNLNWLNIMAYNYKDPSGANITSARAALHDPTRRITTDDRIRDWIQRGLSANKLVLGLPFFGSGWTLQNSEDNAIGAPVTGPATGLSFTEHGSIAYKNIKQLYIRKYRAAVKYNATYVMNYCINGSTWIDFDDVKAIEAKVSYARKMGLLGYYVLEVTDDDNWVLSLAAAKEPGAKVNNVAAAGNFNSNAPDLQIFSYADIEMATSAFSFENKLGEGGYGPVYKGILENGQEIAVKKLSKTSTQGYEEFKNEVTLTAKLQHVNLVRVLGFCIERDEQIIIYEYMPNKSLDFYLFDQAKQGLLDWNKRVHIIEGITQGLLYLQEYSRWTIIHRDLKASNILLDKKMKPKISDFGMAKIFTNEEHEANTGRIVGTYGYVPPEYIKRGLYSTKSDVYSFGVLLLQIISGKKNACCYGLSENLSLLDHAYDRWKSDNGCMEFMDPSLDDTLSSCKLSRCLQIALLCVQENAVDRPTMLEVASILKSESAALTTPKLPAFSIKRNEEEDNKSELKPKNCSINETTISEMVAR